MKMEQTECYETSEYTFQTPGNYPEGNIQHTITLLQDIHTVSVPNAINFYGLVMLFAAFAGGVSLQRSVAFEVPSTIFKIQFSTCRKHRRYCKYQQQINRS